MFMVVLMLMMMVMMVFVVMLAALMLVFVMLTALMFVMMNMCHNFFNFSAKLWRIYCNRVAKFFFVFLIAKR